MIIYLYGPDSYKRQEKLNLYVEKFKEKHSGLTVEYFDLADAEQMAKLKDFSTAQSLFADSKFGVLENAAEAEAKTLNEIFKIAATDKILTLAISADKALIKEFKVPTDKPNICEEFPVPKSAEFGAFLKKEAARLNLKLDAKMTDSLIMNYQGDGWGAVTEMEKMALGAATGPVIAEQNFFALTGAFGSEGPVSYRLPALERLLVDNEPAMIFNFLASRAGADMKNKMADFDVAIKSGKLEYEEVLFALALGPLEVGRP